MDFEQAKQDILTWITEFVEVSHADLAGWPPCPYARRARVNGLLDLRAGKVDPYMDLKNIDMGRFEVIAYVYDPTEFTAAEFENHVQSVNTAFLIPKNMIALADHPDCAEIVNGVRMNQGQWVLAFVQSLSQLNGHARQLAEKGFYRSWPEDYLQSLFAHRQDPRS